MSGIKLLPCPFCGGENVIETYNNFVPVLLCGGCGAMMTIPVSSYSTSYKKILAKKWNTRKPIQEIVERLEEKSDNIPIQYEYNYDQGFDDGICYSIDIVEEVGGMNE